MLACPYLRISHPPAHIHTVPEMHTVPERQRDRATPADSILPCAPATSFFLQQQNPRSVGAVLLCLLLLMAGNLHDGRRDRRCPKFRALSISAIPSAHGASRQTPTSMQLSWDKVEHTPAHRRAMARRLPDRQIKDGLSLH